MPQSPLCGIKNVGEELMRRSEISTCSLRFFNVYGPNQSAEVVAAVIPAFKKRLNLATNARYLVMVLKSETSFMLMT